VAWRIEVNCPSCNTQNVEVISSLSDAKSATGTFANFCKTCGRDLRPYHKELQKYNESRIKLAGTFMRYSTIYKGRYFQTIVPLAYAAFIVLRGGFENYIILTGSYFAILIFMLASVIRFRVITRDDVLEARNLFHTSRVRWADIREVKKISKKNTRFSKTYKFIAANGSVKINFNRFSPICFHDVLNRIPAPCIEAINLDEQTEIQIDEHAQMLEWFKPKSLLITFLYILAIGFFIDLLSGFQFFTYSKTISRWIAGYMIISLLCLAGLTVLFWVFPKDKLTDPLHKRVLFLLLLITFGALFIILISQVVKLIGR
jgi:hypothetical protein